MAVAVNVDAESSADNAVFKSGIKFGVAVLQLFQKIGIANRLFLFFGYGLGFAAGVGYGFVNVDDIRGIKFLSMAVFL